MTVLAANVLEATRFRAVGPRNIDEIATRFRQIIDEYGGAAILPYSYLGTEGILNGLTVGDPFFHALGATVSERTFCDSGSCTAYFMTLGPTAGMDPESFVHSRYIILWACNVRSTNLHMWPFIKQAQENGAKVVAIDPLRHRTAQSADWYLPIRPGTDGALALAMMHVIINGSTPPLSHRPSASVWPLNATPEAAKRCDPSPACPPSSALGAMWEAGSSSCHCGPFR